MERAHEARAVADDRRLHVCAARDVRHAAGVRSAGIGDLPGADCPTLDGELHDTSNCGGPASGYVECDGGWTIITAGDMTAWDIYFKDGAFYGYIVHDHTAPAHCTYGPDSFAPPSCMATIMKLPVCP